MRLPLSLVAILSVALVASEYSGVGCLELKGSLPGTAAERRSCPEGSTRTNRGGAPVCVCDDPQAHWIEDTCQRGFLEHADYLDPHNEARAAVGSVSLVWNEDAAKSAKAWSEHLARDNRCQGVHPTDPHYPYSQNLVWWPGITTRDAVNMWVSEGGHWTYSRIPEGEDEHFEEYGHYTNMVWNSSRSVGCGFTACDTGMNMWACEYYPPGNIMGSFPF